MARRQQTRQESERQHLTTSKAGIQRTAHGWSGRCTPELAKRNVTSDSTGHSRLIQMTAMTLVQSTRNAGGSHIPEGRRRSDIRILDIYRGAASVRVTAATWVDYMHMAKYNNRWVIVNVLWENDPPDRP